MQLKNNAKGSLQQLFLVLRDYSLMFSATGGQDSNGNLLDMVGPTFSSFCLVLRINFNLS